MCEYDTRAVIRTVKLHVDLLGMLGRNLSSHIRPPFLLNYMHVGCSDNGVLSAPGIGVLIVAKVLVESV